MSDYQHLIELKSGIVSCGVPDLLFAIAFITLLVVGCWHLYRYW